MGPPASPAQRRQIGSALARALGGAWRTPAPPLRPGHDLDERSLAALQDNAIRGGAGALLSRRLQAAGATSEVATALRQVHRQQALEEALSGRKLARLATALAERGVAFTLIKGPSVASRYPEPGLRPFCDLDVVVSPSDEPAARQACAALGDVEVDLHTALPHLSPEESREALSRAVLVELAGVPVRVLPAEESLRLLARHALIHGVWRPVWLCDLALLLEQSAPTLDVERVLGDDAPGRRSVRIALALCRDALGANVEPATLAEPTLPRWLLPALHEQWGTRQAAAQRPLRELPQGPRALWDEAKARFRDPLTASAALGEWSELPRLPVRIADFALRLQRYLRR